MAVNQPNVIILTSGISGSSVLAGLISRAGYWTGKSTHKKEYDTFENQALIDLDLRLFKEANYTGNYAMEFSADAIAAIESLGKKLDKRPFVDFIEECNGRRPWVWKDPRLWLTIRFWKPLLNLEECRFVLLTRDFTHHWVSGMLRRHIRSYGSMKRYEQSIRDSLTDFLSENRLPYLHITFEDLVAEPEKTIQELNAHIGTGLSVKDLAAVYNKPLYKAPRSSRLDFAKAVLIYVKNYSERFDLQEKRR